ncbi:unnamed protein product [Spirodela intermedia]|uniref:non-specific serine/threonine protein kinase n=1 Tax=Spirodela intermedia TaxID=51605 RepID=A0A7I8JQZ5_SPIIN|nr:unnamed protein product [Spirodela intermedia]CAA6672566.1 unnamed protein product [Spirodela intermedia]
MKSIPLLCFYLCLAQQVVYSFQANIHPLEVAALTAIAKNWGIQSFDNTTIDCRPDYPGPGNDDLLIVDCDCSSGSIKVYARHAGPVPMELFDLAGLTTLNLSENKLSGTLPPQLGSLTQLKFLSLRSNRFSGPIPKELGELNSLEELHIDSSGLTGEIPAELGKLKFFGRLVKLEEMRIHGTELEGPIPSNYSALTNLRELSLGDLTKVDSTVAFVESLNNLSILSLRNCLIVGPLPNKLESFLELVYLDLSFNKLTGHIPDSFQNLTSIQALFLGSNNLSGLLPQHILVPSMTTLNFIGTSVDTDDLRYRWDILSCLRAGASCSSKDVPCKYKHLHLHQLWGAEQESNSGIIFSADSEDLGAASFYLDPHRPWLVSSSSSYFPSSAKSVAATDLKIEGTSDPHLYKTARLSTGSLRYFALRMKPGNYSDDDDGDGQSLVGPGRRLFDVYLQDSPMNVVSMMQGVRVLRDFNIQAEANGSRRALVKEFTVNVSVDGIVDIHFFWAGRGTCCIPRQGTFGPLVSAINISRHLEDEETPESGRRNSGGGGGLKKEIVVGIVFGCAAGLLILASVLYLWWKKDDGEGSKWAHRGFSEVNDD